MREDNSLIPLILCDGGVRRQPILPPPPFPTREGGRLVRCGAGVGGDGNAANDCPTKRLPSPFGGEVNPPLPIYGEGPGERSDAHAGGDQEEHAAEDRANRQEGNGQRARMLRKGGDRPGEGIAEE